jgi:hypothetical protein
MIAMAGRISKLFWAGANEQTKNKDAMSAVRNPERRAEWQRTELIGGVEEHLMAVFYRDGTFTWAIEACATSVLNGVFISNAKSLMT